MKNHNHSVKNNNTKISLSSYFDKVISYMLDKNIKRAYTRKGWHWYNLPFYAKVGKYELCIYAMDFDWNSMRIKIEKDLSIWKVIKKGVY